MAGLIRKQTGTYAVQFYDSARTPKRKRVPTGVRDKRAAERLRRDWEARYAEGRYDPWTQPPPTEQARPVRRQPLTLGQARSRFLLSRSHKAPNTIANYERVTGWFVAHAGNETLLSDVTASRVQEWIGGLSIKPVTRANYVRHLRAWFRYCIREQILTADPCEGVRLERVPKHFPKALRPHQVEAAALYAEANARDGASRSSAWAAPFIRLGAETAMRRNELLHLRWEHVDLDAGHLTVSCTDAFTSKSGAERRIPLSSRARSVLQRHLQTHPSRSGRVLEGGGGVPVHPGTCSKSVKRFAVAAGVPALTPHVLRHSCITWLIERGVPVPVVQRFAGHADASTTMLYCSVADDVYADQIRGALG